MLILTEPLNEQQVNPDQSPIGACILCAANTRDLQSHSNRTNGKSVLDLKVYLSLEAPG